MRARFTPEEWETLDLAPLWVTHAVAQADEQVHPLEPEFLTRLTAGAWRQEDPLLRETLSDIAVNPIKLHAKMDARPGEPSVHDSIAAVARVVDAHLTPDETARYKNALLELGTATAIIDFETAEAETQRLERIRQALGA